MQIIQQLPHPALASYVRCYWELTHELASDQRLEIPFGCTGRTHVVIPLINTFYMRFGLGSRQQTPSCALTGQVTQPLTKYVSGFTRVLVIDFTPTGLHALWPMPVNELSNHPFEMAEIVGPTVRSLTEQLLNTPGTTRRFKVLDTYLLGRRAGGSGTDGRIEAAVWQISQQPGFVHVAQLAQQLNCSERTLNRRFTEQVGVSPKLYARMLRFLHIRQRLEEKPTCAWPDLVLAGGYYDQAHLIHEFKEFTGQPPRLYGSRHQPLHDFLRRA